MAALDPLAVSHSRSVVTKVIQALASAGTQTEHLHAIAELSKSYPHDGFGVTVNHRGRCDSATIFLSGASNRVPLRGMQRKLANDYNGVAAFTLCKEIVSGIHEVSFDGQFGLTLAESGQIKFKGMLTCPPKPAADLIEALTLLDIFNGELAPISHPPPSSIIDTATIDTIGVNERDGALELKVYLESDFSSDDLRGLLDQYPPYWSDSNVGDFVTAAAAVGYHPNAVVAPIFGNAFRRIYFMSDDPPRIGEVMEAMQGFFSEPAAANLCARLEAAGCKPVVLRISDNGSATLCRIYMEQLNSDNY